MAEISTKIHCKANHLEKTHRTFNWVQNQTRNIRKCLSETQIMAFLFSLNHAVLNDCVCCCTSVTVPEMSQPYTNKNCIFLCYLYFFLLTSFSIYFSFSALFNLWQTNRSEVAWFVSVLGTYQVKILSCIAYVMSVVMRREWEIVVSCFLKEKKL